MEELINKAKDYFRSLNIENGLYKVVIQLPRSWGIIDSPNKDLSIEIIDSKTNQYIIIGDMDKTDLRGIFDFIDIIIQTNVEILNKKSLFKQKSDELINIFSEYSLDELKTLEFKIKRKSKRGRKPIRETTENDTSSNNIVDDNNQSKSDENDNGNDVASTEPINDETIILKESDIDKLGF